MLKVKAVSEKELLRFDRTYENIFGIKREEYEKNGKIKTEEKGKNREKVSIKELEEKAPDKKTKKVETKKDMSINREMSNS